MGITPFSLSNTIRVSQGPRGTIYTFDVVSEAPIDPFNSCANSLLYKAEFASRAVCRRAVANTYINGDKRTPQFDRQFNVQKIVKIGMAPGPPGTVVGTIGFELDASGPCPTLEQMCDIAGGSCVYALFDYTKLCCPLGFNIRPV